MLTLKSPPTNVPVPLVWLLHWCYAFPLSFSDNTVKCKENHVLSWCNCTLEVVTPRLRTTLDVLHCNYEVIIESGKVTFIKGSHLNVSSSSDLLYADAAVDRRVITPSLYTHDIQVTLLTVSSLGLTDQRTLQKTVCNIMLLPSKSDKAVH